MPQGSYQTNTITTQVMANNQAAATIETKQARVIKTYGSSTYVSSADVQILGTAGQINAPNMTGQIITAGASVTINFLNGNPYKPQITGWAGSAAAANSASASSIGLAGAGFTQGSPDGSPTSAEVILWGADLQNAPNGYVAEAGANITFNTTPATYTSGGEQANGTFTVAMTVLVATSLPSGTFDDGTLLDLVDSFGVGQGCYRWVAATSTWELRTPVSGGSPTGAAGGDLSGTYPNPVVAQLQGKSFQNPGVAGGQAAFFNGAGFVEYYGGSLGSVYVVAVNNIALSGVPTIDGVTITEVDTIVLLTGQTTASQNGPWVVNTTGNSSGTWGRPNWWTSGATYFAGCFTIPVEYGTNYANTLWSTKNLTGLIIDTSDTFWVPIAAPSASPFLQSIASSSTPAINVVVTSQFNITALAANITGFTVTGTPNDGQELTVRILDNGTPRTITWGSSFASSGSATLLSITVANMTHTVKLIYDANKGKFYCLSCDSTGYS